MGNKWSSVSSGMAVICAVHCMALPVLAGATSLTHDHDGGTSWMELAMLAFTALVGFCTLGFAYRQHGRFQPLLLLAAGLVLMTAGHFALSGTAATAATLFGVLSVVGAQLVNRRHSATCSCGPHSLTEDVHASRSPIAGRA